MLLDFHYLSMIVAISLESSVSLIVAIIQLEYELKVDIGSRDGEYWTKYRNINAIQYFPNNTEQFWQLFHPYYDLEKIGDSSLKVRYHLETFVILTLIFCPVTRYHHQSDPN